MTDGVFSVELDAQSVGRLLSWLVGPEGPPPYDIPADKAQVALRCGERLFLKAPPLVLDDDKAHAFEALIGEQFGHSPTRDVSYTCPYPKYDFLRYLVSTGRYLLHGSGSRDLQTLVPRPQKDWAGRPTTAVFASGDGIWPMFFALLNRSVLQGSIRNACIVVDISPQESARFYFFSVNAESLAAGVWREGAVHVLPREPFAPTSDGPVRFDEWCSAREVPVLARIPVFPADFPFLNSVTAHREDEPITETWLRFRERQAVR